MQTTRREFLYRSGGGLAAAALLARLGWAQESKIRLSACDWSIRAADPSGLEVAKQIGLDGLEISAGDPADVLKIGDAEYRKQYTAAMQETGLVVSSIAMGLLNNAPFATEPRGPAWLEQVIGAAKDLDAKVILLAFFGKGDLLKDKKLKEDEVAAVVERLKVAAPIAKDAGVIIGIENTLSGADNLRILEQVGHESVRVYYDVGNSTYNDYDVPAEIRALGDRICQIHFKDGAHYLGEGEVQMEPVAQAIADIKYSGWVVLETAIPSKDRDADFKRNADFVKGLLKLA